MGDMMHPKDVRGVLKAARNDFLVIIGKLLGSQLSKAECQLMLYYMEAIVILKHEQRPGVVEHMLVSTFFHNQEFCA